MLGRCRTTGGPRQACTIPRAEESWSRAGSTFHAPYENPQNAPRAARRAPGAGRRAPGDHAATGPGARDGTCRSVRRGYGAAVVAAPCTVSAASRDSARAYFLR